MSVSTAAETAGEPRSPAARAFLRKFALPLLLFAYVAVLFGATAVSQQGLFERDGYFHARFAQLMPERGLSRHFPWTDASTWKDQFCDKEFLYHLGMSPFAQIGPEPIFGARLYSCLLAVAVVVTLHWVLRSHRARWPTFFAALPLAAGGLFIARLGMIRSHVLSMVLILLGVHLLIGKRWKALLALGFVYAWSYTVPFVLLITAVPFVLGRWLRKGGCDWRSAAAAGAGAILGLAIHPYTPITLETLLTYVQVFRLGLQGASSAGVELGNEIYRYSFPVFFDVYPLLVLAVPTLVAFTLYLRRRLEPETVGAVAAALVWFGMTVVAPRFVEYSVLLLTVAGALVCRDALASQDEFGLLLAGTKARRCAAALALAVLVGFHVYAMRFYVVYQSTAAPARFFTGAAAWMERNLAPGEIVINVYWDDFPDLFYSAPRQRYLWGLDPTYTIRYDEGIAQMLEEMRTRQAPISAPVLQALFPSRYLIFRASRAGGYPELRSPPFREAYRDGSAVLYRMD